MHFSLSCTRKKCEYKRFAKDLKEYFLSAEKTGNEKEDFILIVFCMNNRSVFYITI